MTGYKYYSWAVSLDDGTRYSYDFEMHEEDPWTAVLRRFGRFLEKEGYDGASSRIEELCAEFENNLENRIQGTQALEELHGKNADN
jgi:hypothetical protein